MTRKKRSAPPTPLQIKAWNKLDAMTAANKYPPSARELMLAVGCNSTSTIMRRLLRGVKEGRVVKLEHGATPKYVPAWWHAMVSENVEKYYAA